ncbi:hypothetical protein Nepgr_028763 [Nepenthes gracilis]|uniref:NAF domain-containing protein n=1 Tax=Nepenthes gracilis TaxID=150966 RepID=A0AAD3TCA4_NEPGR|nr:hypothetical protein Nepgr_028763 [Nepenthes gracilis]
MGRHAAILQLQSPLTEKPSRKAHAILDSVQGISQRADDLVPEATYLTAKALQQLRRLIEITSVCCMRIPKKLAVSGLYIGVEGGSPSSAVKIEGAYIPINHLEEAWEESGCLMYNLAAKQYPESLIGANLGLEVLLVDLGIISLGILGNLVCPEALITQISFTRGLMETIIDQVLLNATTCLGEPCRVPTLGLQGSGCAVWASVLQPEHSFNRDLGISAPALNPQLVANGVSSPLYVFKSTFAEDIHHSESNEEIFGVLSFVFWTLTLLPLFKYVFIVLRVDDNGEGGTFALYSLICRHARVSLLPNRQVADEAVSTYKLEHPPVAKNSSRVKMLLEKHNRLHTALLALVLLGTCMVIGDGLLTPAISIFIAVSGLESLMSPGHHPYAVIPITCFVLVLLFALQHYVPERVKWPVLLVAILSSVVGSQAIISGTFSIINPSQSLGCFPRVKVVHTSEQIHGQVYIPEINWILMTLCVAVTIAFRDTKHLGKASGLAVMTVMLVNPCLTSLVIILCWHKPPGVALCFLLFFGSIESLYFFSFPCKIHRRCLAPHSPGSWPKLGNLPRTRNWPCFYRAYHMKFPASALDGKISLGCDSVIWRAYVYGLCLMELIWVSLFLLDQYVTDSSNNNIGPLVMNAFEMITSSQGLNPSALFNRRQLVVQ